jgi:hypothetical protein
MKKPQQHAPLEKHQEYRASDPSYGHQEPDSIVRDVEPCKPHAMPTYSAGFDFLNSSVSRGVNRPALER